MEASFDILSGSKRLDAVPSSGIRKVMNRVAKLRSEGHSVISFSAGEPGFNTPEPIKKAAIEALQNNMTHYASNRGSLSLRTEIAGKIREDTGVVYDPETELLVTCGGAEGINDCLLSVIDPGDEVIILKPAFINYEALVREIGAVPVDVNLDPGNGFQIDLDAVERKISKKTKLLVFNSPNNPTGAVYREEDLKGLVQLSEKYNFLLFSDEMYSCLTYEGKKFHSIAEIEGARDRCMIVNGFSKTYAMTGWRLGYVACPQQLMEKIVKHHQYVTTSIATFLQEGMAKAMNLPETKEAVRKMQLQFARQRKAMLTGLDTVPSLSYVVPYGAFYVMVNVAGTGMDGETFSRELLEKAYVATVPADCFGSVYDDYVRFSFAAKEEDIPEGIRRIREFLKYRKV